MKYSYLMLGGPRDGSYLKVSSEKTVLVSLYADEDMAKEGPEIRYLRVKLYGVHAVLVCTDDIMPDESAREAATRMLIEGYQPLNEHAVAAVP